MRKFYAILCLTIASLTKLQAQAPQDKVHAFSKKWGVYLSKGKKVYE